MDAPSQEEPCEPQRERAGRSYEKESLRFFLFAFAQMRAKDFAERRADEVHARPWNERPGIREVLIQMAAEEDLFQANVKKVSGCHAMMTVHANARAATPAVIRIRIDTRGTN